jgi:hypothetical protein
MKTLKLIATCLLAALVTGQSPGQNKQASSTGTEKKLNWSCGSQTLFDANQVAKQVYEQQFAQYRENGSNTAAKMAGTKVIPVVVHVLYNAADVNNPARNLAYNQIQWQIAALNTAFQKNYPSYTNNQVPNGAYAVNTQIQFCLAQVAMGTHAFAPNEPGVVRYQVSGGQEFHTMNSGGQSQLLNITHSSPGNFPFDKYLNIWLVYSITDPGTGLSGTIGYAFFPNSGPPMDGIVFRSDVFGDNTVPYTNSLLLPQLDKGRILAHEAGHYLGLLHTFTGLACLGANGGNCTSQGDLICDTPPTTVLNTVNCRDTNTCSDNLPAYGGVDQRDMLENYMSYADDDCMTTFTSDQSSLMNGVLNTSWPTGRLDMTSSANLIATGLQNSNFCCPTGVLSAGFSYINNCTTYTFTNRMPPCNNNSTYFWNFGDGSTSTSINPIHTYASTGAHPVLCTVTGTNGASVTYTNMVYSGPSYILQQSGNKTVCKNSEQSIYIFFNPFTPSLQLTDGTNIITVNNTDPFVATDGLPNIVIYTFTVTSNVTYTLLDNCNPSTASFTVTNCCGNLVYNGDFQQGNTGFTSDLFNGGPGLGTYTIKDPTVNNGILDVVFDGLANYSGNAMVCDGFSGNNTIVNITNGINTGQQARIWEQTITGILPNTTYYLSYKTTRNILENLEQERYRMKLYDNSGALFTTVPDISQPNIFNNNVGLNFTVFNYTFITPSVVSPNYTLAILQVENFNSLNYDYMLDDILLQAMKVATVFPGYTQANCSGQQITLQANPATTYTWQPGGINASNISVSPSAVTVYTVTGTTGNCNATQEITVTPIACCTNTLPNSVSYYSTTFSSNTNLNGTLYYLAGDIVINPGVTLTIGAARVIMAPNTKISVMPGASFTLFNSWMFACSDMWDGIYLHAGSNLWIQSSFVEHAKRAIVDTLGANKIYTRDVVFNRNRIGMHLKSPLTTTDLKFDYTWYTSSNLNISFPVFSSLGGYMSTGIPPAPAQLLPPPYNTIYGQYGMFLDNTMSSGGSGKIEITYVRTDKVYQGIYSLLSKANIRDTRCYNHSSALYPTGNPCGIYVKGSNVAGLQGASNVSIGGMNAPDKCLFYSNNFGVLNEFSSFLSVTRNDFDGHAIGVMVTKNSSNKGITIRQNKFTNTMIGIDLYDNQWINAEIIENRVDNSSPMGNATSNIAILGAEINPPAANPSTYAAYNIYNNYINNYYNGIILNNTYLTQVNENELSITPDNVPGNIQRGIHFAATSRINVRNNIVNLQTASGNAWWQHGIAGATNIEPVISCNSVTNFYAGIKLDGLNYTPTSGNGIIMNTLSKVTHGIWLDAAGEIGDQFITGPFNSDNQWWSVTTSQTYVSGLSNSANARFYTATSPAPYYLNNALALNANPFPFYTPLLRGAGYASSGQMCSAAISTPPKMQAPVSALAKYFMLDKDADMGATRKRMLLRDLKSGTALGTGEGETLARTVFENQASAENKFFLVDSLVQISQLEANKNYLASAKAINSAISTTCKTEENQKWFNEIYISSQERPLLETEIRALEELAVKCPQYDGMSVFQARSILFNLTYRCYSSTCERESGNGLAGAGMNKNDSETIQLYPNPANKDVTVEFRKSNPLETATMDVYTSAGIQVAGYRLTESKTIVHVGLLSPGVYMYTIKLSSGLSKTSKLIIIK